MVLSTEWTQVELIDLVNDGTGIGFGIVGGRSTGVVVKSILPGGIADKDGRLQSGDHILRIGDIGLRGFSADQVASVLRGSGMQVRMLVARPIESTRASTREKPVVATKALNDAEEFERIVDALNDDTTEDLPSQGAAEAGPSKTRSHYEISTVSVTLNGANDVAHEEPDPDDTDDAQTVRIEVTLSKSECGLGITIAGYVCEREDLSGIFVKGVSEGSEAHKCGLIATNDRIVEVDGECLHACTNYEAVEKLKQTGDIVKLTLERYLRGPKFEHLQEALASTEARDLSPPSPSVTTLSWIPIDTEAQIIEPEGESVTTINSEIYECQEGAREIFVDDKFEAQPTEECEASIRRKWVSILSTEETAEGDEAREIVVAHLTKLTGLGISLEGTVDVEAGVEVRPHHYIRSILPEGPVGANGKLQSGDELLEVNGQRLLGIRHVEVVRILRDLPNAVRLVCARKSLANRVINTSQDREAFDSRNILGGSLKELLLPEGAGVGVVKALSDTSINTSSTATVTNSSLQKARSRSLENTNVAMWREEVDFIELGKTDRGLGFSILDYQDPVDLQATVIVIRSLVPGGAAEADGRIKPGDRLMSVNDKCIKNATLDQAVQALKGTLPGLVKIGLCKPLPLSQEHSIET